MEEYASRFFMLIEQAARLDALDSINKLRIVSFPNQKPVQQRLIERSYKKLARRKYVPDEKRIENNSQHLMALLGVKKK